MFARHALILVAIAALTGSAQGATIAYWNASSLGGTTLADLVGGNQTLTGGSGFNPSAVELVDPVPNPDPASTGIGNGSIFVSSTPGAVPAFTGAPASVFQMTSSSSFTFEGWISADPGSSTRYIASDRHQGNSFDGWFVAITSSDTLQFFSDAGGSTNIISSVVVADADTGNSIYNPHHFAAVWDHTAGEMSLYVDGAHQGTQSHSVASYSVFGFSIGGRNLDNDGAFDDNRLAGNTRLDEMRFSNQALAPSQFLNAIIPEPSSIILLALGMLTLGCGRRIRRPR